MAEHIIAQLLASDQPLWIVGGAARDLLAGRPTRDLDLAVAGDVAALARPLAAKPGGGVGWLADGVARVVVPDLPGWLDLAPLRGADLRADLAQRDFTVNALAIRATPASLGVALTGAGAIPPDDVIDPLGGRADLTAGVLRAASATALADDPLRLLRGARLAAALGLTPDAATLAQARAAAPALAQVAGERIPAELFASFAGRDGTRTMHLLDDLGALTVIVPPLAACRGVTQGTLHYWDVFDHSLAVIDALDHTADLLRAGLATPPAPATPDAAGRIAPPTALDLGGHNADLLARLAEPLAAGQSRLTLLKLAALFHDVGKPFTREVNERGFVRFPGHPEAGVPLTAAMLGRWHLGHTAQRYIEAVVALHMRPGQLAGPQGLTDKAARHFFRDAGDAGLDVALFSIADHFAVYGPTPLTTFWQHHSATVSELVRRRYDTPEDVVPSRLLDGHDLIARYHLTPGSALRDLLERVHTARLEGDITTRVEAFALVERWLREERAHG